MSQHAIAIAFMLIAFILFVLAAFNVPKTQAVAFCFLSAAFIALWW